MCAKKQDIVKELASDNILLSAYLILGECRKLKGDLSVELQAAKDDRKELQQLTNELWETLQKIQAQFRVEAQLMNLIKPLEKGGGNIRNQGNETINLRLTKGRKKSSQ